MMKRLLCLLVCLVLLGTTGAAAEMVSRIAAVVNDDIITTYQLDQALKEHLDKLQRRPSPAQLGAVRRELLNRLVEETLVQQRIDALRLTVTDEEVETALLDVQKQNQLTREELEQAVLSQGMTFEAYRKNLYQQIMRYKLISAEVRSKVEVSEREVVEYYRAHLEEYRFPGKVRLSAISFPLDTQADRFQKEAVQLVANEARERLQQGEDFESVADAYSEEYNAFTAALGDFAYGEMTPEFVSAIEGLEDGAYSAPVEKADALHILRVDERVPGGLRQFDSVKGEIYQMISDQKTDARIKEWTKGLRQKAFIDIRL